jgi:hypothetical protein
MLPRPAWARERPEMRDTAGAVSRDMASRAVPVLLAVFWLALFRLLDPVRTSSFWMHGNEP